MKTYVTSCLKSCKPGFFSPNFPREQIISFLAVAFWEESQNHFDRGASYESIYIPHKLM